MAVVAASALVLAATSLSNSHGPLPRHSGGFGEPTCHRCHSDHPLNEAGATIGLQALPSSYAAGDRYSLQLRVKHPVLERGGFQLTARFEDGTAAGNFEISDTSLLRIQRVGPIEYLSHNADGTAPTDVGSVVWKFTWVAPRSDRRVLFHAAVNVANDDASEYGDRIFTAEFASGADVVKK